MDTIHYETEVDALQNCILRLKDEYGFDQKNIRTEIPVQVGPKRQLVDIIVYKDGLPYILIEVKQKIPENHELVKQNLELISSFLGNRYAMITDGIYDLCYIVQNSSQQNKLKSIPDIPSEYSKSDLIKKQKRHIILKSPELFFWNICEVLRSKTKSRYLTEKEISDDLLKLVGAKTFDENNSKKPQFTADNNENYLKIVTRIENILEQLNNKQKSQIFEPKFKLPHDILVEIIFKIQKYSLTKSKITDSKLGFPYFVFSKNSGEFLTPPNIVTFLTDLFPITSKMKVLDLACGSGKLLFDAGKKGATIVGLDINESMTNLAKINCYLHGIENATILCTNSLDSLDTLSRKSNDVIQPNSFDLIMTHPPFGLTSQIEYQKFSMLATSGSKYVEALFIERSWELLKEGGKLAIILPEGIISNKVTRAIREFITKNFKILGTIGLPDYAFYPYSSIKTSILILEKLGPKIYQNPYNIFIANAENLGYDRHGSLTNVNDFSQIIEKFHVFLKTNKGHTFDTSSNEELRLDGNYFKNISNLGSQKQICLLKEIADISIGVKNHKLRKGDKYRIVKGQQIKDFEIDLSTADLTGFELISIDKFLLKNNDIVLTRSGTVGNVGLCKNVENAIYSDNVIRIRINSNKIIPEYLTSFLHSELGQKQLRQCTTGSTIRGISLSNLEKIQIPILSMSEQNKIAQRLEDILYQKLKLKEASTKFEDSKLRLSKIIEDVALEKKS
ncbi:N-6 DNA methylase [Nitrosarchaeum sp. AC2]|uniref:N-6 DNA methylase n=1 Tax=Nitrosarchaeum sp. AC2 TaxID=2259673 RepID=UPI0015C7DF20|nr:N-6 DNA methylase [Nitrosarchaeum sp. AC2]QLH11015.1 restriction endonuclease [Nitrosarchaeum sp. AC2]